MNTRKLTGLLWGWIPVLALTAGLMVSPAAAAKKIRAAVGLEGTINDNAWYEGGYRGAMKLKDDPDVVEVAFQEKIKRSDLTRVMRRWASEGYDVIFGHGYEWGEIALKLAPRFPKTTFAVASYFNTKSQPNVVTYMVNTHETCYVEGVLSALMTKSRVVGIMGGWPVPNQRAEHNAYVLGVKSVDPKIRVVDVFINDWFDPAKGKEAAYAMIEQGVDVLKLNIFPPGLGSVQAAKEKGIYAIGHYGDQSALAPQFVLTSTQFKWNIAMREIVEDVKKGTVKGFYLKGLPEGGAITLPFAKMVPQDIAQRVRAVEKEIKAGKLKIPFIADKQVK